MRIETHACDGRARCAPYCPVGAILPEPDGKYTIDQDECVECGACRRSAGCPKGCISATPCPWPRSLRPLFSDPLVEHRDTRVPGRGTEEMKTNDLTARFLPGQIGLMVEVGRTALGARLRDAERMTMVLARMGIEIHPGDPLRGLIEDPKSGRLLPEVLNEKVLSVIVECVIREDRLPAALDAVHHAAQGLQSVCSICHAGAPEPPDGASYSGGQQGQPQPGDPGGDGSALRAWVRFRMRSIPGGLGRVGLGEGCMGGAGRRRALHNRRRADHRGAAGNDSRGGRGGSPTDYQICEEETPDGRANVLLVVNPGLGPVDDQRLIDAFLGGLGEGSVANRMMGRMWRESQVVRVERRAPSTTRAGKVLHFHVSRAAR